MVEAPHHETAAASREAQAIALAYMQAADGDLTRALHWALEDLIACETRLAETSRAVSRGFVRADPRGRPGGWLAGRR